ncbi:Hint domain-containing protein [Pseudaestuariivita atlantica]|uniref:Hint domain-containing protein n=1 Tax=Pseudaestuariivita atlantica TaxID=1317121 RepID=UPI00067CD98C|nr:Hint domain-containing protein [Pseudaestuariivita atlantica]
MANFTADDYLFFLGSISGSTLTASGNFIDRNSPVDVDVIDANSDNNIDTTDYFGEATSTYTGFTIILNGNSYAVFNQGPVYSIPYNTADDDLSSFAGTDPNTIGFTNTGENAVVVNCFLTSTLIATPHGERAIETLEPGAHVTLANGSTAPVRWVARQTMRADAVNLSMPASRLPVRIEAGALGEGLPHTDLTLTADHALVMDGLLVNASALVNGATIRFLQAEEMPREFTYWHVELDAHSALLANGLPAESFVDYTGRAAYDNHVDYLALHGAERLIPEMPLPRISARRHLPTALRARLGLEDTDFALSA